MNDIKQAIKDMEFLINAYKTLINDGTDFESQCKRIMSSCEVAIKYLEIQIPKAPKVKHVYENADADGNRGIWVSYVNCPNCEYDLNSDELGIVCPECFQRLY